MADKRFPPACPPRARVQPACPAKRRFFIVRARTARNPSRLPWTTLRSPTGNPSSTPSSAPATADKSKACSSACTTSTPDTRTSPRSPFRSPGRSTPSTVRPRRSPKAPPNALVGLGNCLRLAGRGDRAVEVRHKARARFPDNAEFAAYLALALHDAGRHAEALRTLMDAMLDTTEDIGLAAHQRALRYQAGRLG